MWWIFLTLVKLHEYLDFSKKVLDSYLKSIVESMQIKSTSFLIGDRDQYQQTCWSMHEKIHIIYFLSMILSEKNFFKQQKTKILQLSYEASGIDLDRYLSKSMKNQKSKIWTTLKHWHETPLVWMNFRSKY